MKRIDIDSGAYAASWGLTDFYKDSEAKLREAFNSNEDFETSWGCKKEIRYATIKRDEDCVFCSVTAEMDDLWQSEDLIYDALWSKCKSEEELSDEIIDSIRDAAIDEGIEEHSTETCVCPRDASFEDVCAAISSLEVEAEKHNDEMFNTLCDIVEAHYNYIKANP